MVITFFAAEVLLVLFSTLEQVVRLILKELRGGVEIGAAKTQVLLSPIKSVFWASSRVWCTVYRIKVVPILKRPGGCLLVGEGGKWSREWSRDFAPLDLSGADFCPPPRPSRVIIMNKFL